MAAVDASLTALRAFGVLRFNPPPGPNNPGILFDLNTGLPTFIQDQFGNQQSFPGGGGGSPVPDADAGTKGKVQLAGALGGTAAAPTALGFADAAALATALAAIVQVGALAASTLVAPNATAVISALSAKAPLDNPVFTTAVTLPGDAVSALQPITKQQFDNGLQGLKPKSSARLRTAAALPANTYANGASGVGATLTATSNGALTVDGVAVSLNDIIAVGDEASKLKNGLYSVTQVGSGGAPYILTRTTDMDVAAEVPGAFVVITGGTKAGSLYYITYTGSVTMGTTALDWTASSSTATSTDAVAEGSVNLYFTQARVLATPLTGLSLATGTAIIAADSILIAAGKLQKQITDLTTTVAGKAALGATVEAVSGTTYSFVAGDKGKHKVFTNASGCTATVPAALGTDFVCTWAKAAAAGTLTFAQSSTTLINESGSLVCTALKGSGAIISTDTANTLTLSGPLGSPAAALDVAQQFTKGQASTEVTLTDASTIALDASLSNSFYVLLTAGVGATRALGLPSNPGSGQKISIIVKQSSAGNNALTFNAIFKHDGGTDPVLSTAANAIDVLSYVYSPAAGGWFGGLAGQAQA